MSYEFWTRNAARDFSQKVNNEIHDKLHDQIMKIYQGLQVGKHTIDNKLEVNDDYDAWLEQLPDFDNNGSQLDAICLTDQNCNFIIILKELEEDMHHFIAFRYYKDISDEGPDFCKKRISMTKAVDEIEDLVKYSDKVPGNSYVSRPNLEYFKKNDVLEKFQQFNYLLEIKKAIVTEEMKEYKESLKTHLKDSGLSDSDINDLLNRSITVTPNNEYGITELPAFSSLLYDIEATLYALKA